MKVFGESATSRSTRSAWSRRFLSSLQTCRTVTGKEARYPCLPRPSGPTMPTSERWQTGLRMRRARGFRSSISSGGNGVSSCFPSAVHSAGSSATAVSARTTRRALRSSAAGSSVPSQIHLMVRPLGAGW